MSQRSVKILQYSVLCLTVVLPILGLFNCSGMNEANLAPESCIIDHPWLRAYASFYGLFLLVSAFTIGIPLIIYGFMIFFLLKLIAKMRKE